MCKIIIAIDGASSTGKSTLAKAIAKKLNYIYIDSGAMYRAITYYFLKNHIHLENDNEIENALQNITIAFKNQRTILNNKDIEAEIRTLAIAQHVSQVAALAQVRNKAVYLQQQLGIQKGVVMDGRDIGTTVFPNAELKLFITANKSVRAQRRYEELKQTQPTVTLQEVEENLVQRDEIDSHRSISPLLRANDAIEIDNTHFTMDELIEKVYQLVKEKIQFLKKEHAD